MAGVVEGFRWALLGGPAPSGPMLLLAVGVVFLLLGLSAVYFLKVELTFADVI
jgi:lipopolysaccharide transport system permease protein